MVPTSASGSMEMLPQNKPPPGAHCWQGAPHWQCHTVPGVWDGVFLPHIAAPRAQPHPWQGLGVLAWPRDLPELAEEQLPLWAQRIGHENTPVTLPHSHQGSQGWEDTTGLPSTLLGLASLLM